jgi:hypothetical protein
MRGTILAKQSHMYLIFESSSESSLLGVGGDFNVDKIHSTDSKSLSMALPFTPPPCHGLCFVDTGSFVIASSKAHSAGQRLFVMHDTIDLTILSYAGISFESCSFLPFSARAFVILLQLFMIYIIHCFIL